MSSMHYHSDNDTSDDDMDASVDRVSVQLDNFENILMLDDDAHGDLVEEPRLDGVLVRPPEEGAIPVMPSPNDVCFGSILHPGTKRWREVVKIFSEEHLTCSDEVVDLILQHLANENITRFLVLLDGTGNPTSNIRDSLWYEASRDEISKKTKQRFKDQNKLNGERRPFGTRRGAVSVAPPPPAPTLDSMIVFRKALEDMRRHQTSLEQEMQHQSTFETASALEEIESGLALLLDFVRRQREMVIENSFLHDLELEMETENGMDGPFGIQRLSRRCQHSSVWAWGRRHRRTIRVTNFQLIIIVAGQVIVVTAAILLGVLLRNDNGAQPVMTTTSPVRTTMDSIKERGHLNCGVVESSGFSELKETIWTGFEVDMCRAISAVIFGDGDHVEFTPLSVGDRFVALQSGLVDVLAARATYTMERDLYEPTAKAGLTFSVPYLHAGLTFAGIPHYVACAEQRSTAANCSGLQICAEAGTTYVQVVMNWFPNSTLIPPSIYYWYVNFVEGYCNVLAGDRFELAKDNLLQAGYTGDYTISSNLFTNEPIALVTRDDDAEWSDVVNLAVLALLSAEEQNVTQRAALDALHSTLLFGDSPRFSLLEVVAAVGNYGDIYKRNLQSMVPRATVDKQNNGSSPLTRSLPFGDMWTTGPGPTAGGTLSNILQRGYLICGVMAAPFFATFNLSSMQWEGFDVDHCKAISAAIFRETRNVTFVQPNSIDCWESLANRTIDVLSSSTWTYQLDLYEPSTRTGFTFTQPTFYTGLQFGGIPPYIECAGSLETIGPTCISLLICITNGTTDFFNAERLFPPSVFSPQQSDEKVLECLVTGEGNVIGGHGYTTSTTAIRDVKYPGPYEADSLLFSRDILAFVTRQDDPQWSSFVNWVIIALTFAEEQGISQVNFNQVPTTNLFGTDFTTMLQDAVREVGSRKEILMRNGAGTTYPVRPINTLNMNPLGPQHYPPVDWFL